MMPLDVGSQWHAMNMQQRHAFVEQMSPEQWEYFRYYSDIRLRKNQILPTANHRYLFICGGRGGGKDFMSAAHMRKLALNGQKGLMVVAPTYAYLDDPGGMVDSLLDQFPPNQAQRVGSTIRVFDKSHKLINEITLKTTQQNNGYLIGANVSFAWLNELRICWDGDPEKQEKMFHLFDASIRLPGAQLLITTNPDNTPIFRYLHQLHKEQPDLCYYGSNSMFDNEYLDERTKNLFIKQWQGTRYFDSELNGVLDFSTPGALWTQTTIDQTRHPDLQQAFAKTARIPNLNPYHFLARIIVAADPSFTSDPETSDEFGISVQARGKDGHLYILEDQSAIMSPEQAATTIQQLRAKYQSLTSLPVEVVGEKNGLGEYLTYALRTKDPTINPKLIHISEGKMTRAQPISLLWEQKLAHLVGSFPKLEEEMMTYTGNPKQKSPNRLDAMVLGAQELMLEKRAQQPTPYQSPRFR
jgi:phage terminase large subunit-like protein